MKQANTNQGDEEGTVFEIFVLFAMLAGVAWVGVTIIYWAMQGGLSNQSSLVEIIAAQIEYIGNLRIW